MPPGHNGPYRDPETPVRNTAHWAITFLKAFEITREKKFEVAASNCQKYLMHTKARPMGATFWHRRNPEKDFSNGLVGQAWTIEALLQLGKHFSTQEPIDVAVSTFKLHPFVDRFALWRRVNVDGSYYDFDKTFNHQLWFAASGALVYEATGNKYIGDLIHTFLTRLPDNFFTYPSGLIRHKSSKFLAKTPLHRLKNFYQIRGGGTYLKMKAEGYHSFNLYAFALLKTVFPDHNFWGHPRIRKALEYATTSNHRQKVAESKYGYPYNPPGFEVAYAMQVFGLLDDKEISSWVSEQIRRCYNFDTNLMSGGGTADENTAIARIYEATRLKDYELVL